MVLVDVIAGARPNFMKIAPIIRAIDAARSRGGRLQHRLIHTGQHYDPRMSGDFFTQLGIPEPFENFAVGSGTQAQQAAAIMTRYEELLLRKRSNACLVVGDVTSTMACAIAAQKVHVPVGHVEGGIRSRDWSMPEEINRLVTDSISNWFFTTSIYANQNLRNEGVSEDRIFFVGNTMIDTLAANLDRLAKPSFWSEFALKPHGYFVATLHRPSNVDDDQRLLAVLESIGSATRGMPVIFPIHPRVRDAAARLQIPANLAMVEPQPYLEFNYLVRHAKGVITDSGGITEEATYMKVPCMTLRDSTERPETISIGSNELVGTDPRALKAHLDKLFDGLWKSGGIPEMWDGHAAPRIVTALEGLLAC
jgi:UDP-N-acetylglucosamine 2-epimerase (non-hydrolysing)